MDNMRFMYVLIFFILFSISCDEEQSIEDNFVVEAFLFAGEDVNQITIKEIQSIDELGNESIPIEDAIVTLSKNNESYPLVFDVTTEKYSYQGNTLDVNPGDVFRLEARRGTRSATAETIVPPATSGLTISGNQIIIPSIFIRFGIEQELFQLFINARLSIQWDNPTDKLHFIVIDNLVAGDPIFPADFPIPEETLKLIQSFRYISAPTANTSFEIPGLSLDTYGTYRAKVYRVNQEYADLYNNQVQDSRDLNAPPSNIQNALGIFSAFASDSVFFEVVQ